MTPEDYRAKARELRDRAGADPQHAELANRLADGWDAVAQSIETLTSDGPIAILTTV
jgi:hypothetical protein